MLSHSLFPCLSSPLLCTANEQRARFRDAAKGATSTSPRRRYCPTITTDSKERKREIVKVWERNQERSRDLWEEALRRGRERRRGGGGGEGKQKLASLAERDGRQVFRKRANWVTERFVGVGLGEVKGRKRESEGGIWDIPSVNGSTECECKRAGKIDVAKCSCATTACKGCAVLYTWISNLPCDVMS